MIVLIYNYHDENLFLHAGLIGLRDITKTQHYPSHQCNVFIWALKDAVQFSICLFIFVRF